MMIQVQCTTRHVRVSRGFRGLLPPWFIVVGRSLVLNHWLGQTRAQPDLWVTLVRALAGPMRPRGEMAQSQGSISPGMTFFRESKDYTQTIKSGIIPVFQKYRFDTTSGPTIKSGSTPRNPIRGHNTARNGIHDIHDIHGRGYPRYPLESRFATAESSTLAGPKKMLSSPSPMVATTRRRNCGFSFSFFSTSDPSSS